MQTINYYIHLILHSKYKHLLVILVNLVLYISFCYYNSTIVALCVTDRDLRIIFADDPIIPDLPQRTEDPPMFFFEIPDAIREKDPELVWREFPHEHFETTDELRAVIETLKQESRENYLLGEMRRENLERDYDTVVHHYHNLEFEMKQLKARLSLAQNCIREMQNNPQATLETISPETSFVETIPATTVQNMPVVTQPVDDINDIVNPENLNGSSYSSLGYTLGYLGLSLLMGVGLYYYNPGIIENAVSIINYINLPLLW